MAAPCAPCARPQLEDVYRTYDYGFNDDAFWMLTGTWGGHVAQGIASYVNTRASSPTDKPATPNSHATSKHGSTPQWWTTPSA